MKFTVLKENLLSGLNVVSKAVNTRSPLPVLSNVLIKTEKGRIKLVTSDLQITITTFVGAKIDEDGEITVPAKILNEFVNQVRDDKIEFILNGAILNLKTDKAKASITGIPASEFPSIEEVEGGIELNLKAEDFANAIQKVQFVVAVDEGRPVLTGIYFKTEKDKLIIAGTDGYRMAEQIIKIEKTDDVVCIIPAKSFAEILKLFSAKSDQIKFVVNNERNFAKLETEDMQAQFRMIDGEYPDYKAILPDDFSTEVRISSSEFSNGIKLSSIFSRDIGNMIKIVIKDKSIKSLSQPSEAGSNVTEMLGDIDGEDISIAFNAKYLLDFVNNVQTDEVVFKAEGPLKPVLFSRSGDKDYFYLVMPMKATW